MCSSTLPTSEPRFELEAAGLSIEVRPVLDKSICRALRLRCKKMLAQWSCSEEINNLLLNAVEAFPA